MSIPARAGEPATWWNTATRSKFLKIQKRSIHKRISAASLVKDIGSNRRNVEGGQIARHYFYALPRPRGRKEGLNGLNHSTVLWTGPTKQLNVWNRRRRRRFTMAAKECTSFPIIAIFVGLISIVAG